MFIRQAVVLKGMGFSLLTRSNSLLALLLEKQGDKAFYQLHFDQKMALYTDSADLATCIQAVATLRLDYCNLYGLPLKDNVKTPLGTEHCGLTTISC